MPNGRTTSPSARRKDKEEELRTNEHIISENKKKNKELRNSREIQAYMAEMEFRRDESSVCRMKFSG
jgi:hypothetical protein